MVVRGAPAHAELADHVQLGKANKRGREKGAESKQQPTVATKKKDGKRKRQRTDRCREEEGRGRPEQAQTRGTRRTANRCREGNARIGLHSFLPCAFGFHLSLFGEKANVLVHTTMAVGYLWREREAGGWESIADAW
jgi:hypothetical protein